MKRIGLGAIFALFMSMAISSYAQHTGRDSSADSQEQPKNPKEAPPAAKAPRDQKEATPPKTKEQETTPSSKQKPAPKQPGTSAQKQPTGPSGKSTHIPDEKFKASFGKQHTFAVKRVITNTTVIVPNQTQFIYGGYTFIFLDPWPEDWLFTDDCYVDYVDEEYFLFDVSRPGVRVALSVAG